MPIGPFVDPPEEMIVARLGDSYKIIMNKFCIYRPMLILHTTLYESQTNDLNEADLTAGWGLLHAFKTPQILIYNCGIRSGCSQGHKHLQVFPRQDGGDFQMWPSKAPRDEGMIRIPEGFVRTLQPSRLMSISVRHCPKSRGHPLQALSGPHPEASHCP